MHGLSRRLCRYISYIIILCLFLAPLSGGLTGTAYGEQVSLLNDRAADMVGATPLVARDLVLPAGLTGQGQIVGLADSGLDKGSMTDIHPDLASIPGEMPKVALLKSWAGRAVPDDPVGHGTHLAGTIAGTGQASGGKYRGIAPGASLYVQGLLDKDGQLTVPSDLEDLFWPAYAGGVRVHVNGWGGGQNTYGANTSQIDSFVRKHPDFLPVFGAGNSGPGTRTLTAEANSKNALVVGAGQIPRPAFGPDSRYAGEVASFSSRGPTRDGRVKPDLVVPASAVISACSRLTESNFVPNQNYTRMGGTSQAAAIAGGAAALLCQYLERQGVKPSSALLKAMLVNGARFLSGSSTDCGFGQLDIAGTVLALDEGMFRYKDEKYGLAQGEMAEYRFQVFEARLPVKVTLAWADPPAAAGTDDAALVNNLDLVVEGPGGTSYLGNHFLGLRGADDRNNVEQVLIATPVAGEYVVKVKASSIKKSVRTGAARPVQDFALVYGQSLQTGIVYSVKGNTIKLADGAELDTADREMQLVVDGGVKTANLEDVLPGSDVYAGVNCIYIFSRTLKTGGVQVLCTPQGWQVVEISGRARTGGFYLDATVQHDLSRFVFLNGKPVEYITDIPPGVEIHASVNPSSQTAWQLRAAYVKKSGTVYRVDTNKRELQLLEGGPAYRLAPWAAVSFIDDVVDTGFADAPYGTAQVASLESILPGMPVQLLLSPETGEVQYISVRRELAQGRLDKVEPEAARVVLETGNTYELFPGATVSRDAGDASLQQLQPGDYLQALLLTGTNSIIALQADTRVTYGQVIYASEKQGLLYLTDYTNRFHIFKLTSRTQVFRWNLPVDIGTLNSGSWVRLTLGSDGDEIRRVDIAEVAEEKTAFFSSYNKGAKTFTLSDGSTYRAGNTTLVSKAGYALGLEDLAPGEKVRVVVLSASGPWRSVPVLVEAEEDAGAARPVLSATARVANPALIIQGHTSADRVYLFRKDGSREAVTVKGDGSFTYLTRALSGEDSVQLAAIDTRTGGITGIKTDVAAFSGENPQYAFNDIENYPGREAIETLSGRGLVRGYTDGSFRPGQAITRLEMLVMLVRIKGWSPTAVDGRLFSLYKDFAQVPGWARGMMAAAWTHGLVVGYPDGTLRPGQPATRCEAAVLLDRAFAGNAGASSSPPYQDFPQVPWWARAAVSRGYDRGILDTLNSLLPTRFLPTQPVTRGEAAVMVSKALQE